MARGCCEESWATKAWAAFRKAPRFKNLLRGRQIRVLVTLLLRLGVTTIEETVVSLTPGVSRGCSQATAKATLVLEVSLFVLPFWLSTLEQLTTHATGKAVGKLCLL